jgi:putative DNA primase/helicase
MRDAEQARDYFRQHPQVGESLLKSENESSGEATDTGAADWPDPEPLGSDLPPVEPFSSDLLPESFRALIDDVTERMGTPVAYAAAATTVALAGCVNRRATIQPKEKDTSWLVVPNLWGAIVGPPGLLKSPLLHAVTVPLRGIEEMWRQEYDGALDDFKLEKERAELGLTAWRESYKSSLKKNQTPPIRPDTSLAPPRRKRLIIGDPTFEKLHEVLGENPAGVFVIRDELSGWIAELDRLGREGEREFFLSAWNGDCPHTVDRVGRGSIHVPACCVSLFGNINPARLRAYLVDALKDGPSNDGLFQRFQVMVWPDTPNDWRLIDRAPNADAAERARKVFEALTRVSADEPRRLSFDPAAQEPFNEWLAELESKIRGGQLHQAMVAHLGKFRSLMPSLALLFELADWAACLGGGDSVSLDHARQAADACDCLESHARRVHSCIVSPQLRAARELAERIQSMQVGKLDERSGLLVLSARDIYLKQWSGLDTPERVFGALEILEDAGWVRPERKGSGPSGGRPGTRYLVNPRLFTNA